MISLFLLGSYYVFLDNAPVVAVVGLLLYVGCYQVNMLFFLYPSLDHRYWSLAESVGSFFSSHNAYTVQFDFNDSPLSFFRFPLVQLVGS